MSLRFYFGPSDEEVSGALYQKIIADSMENPRTQYLVIVPDQATMQTQKQLVAMHPRGGILNMDVLSFGRLYHRVMEELGREAGVVLDDTGKCLVLEKVASDVKDQCPVLGGLLNRQGYIQEVKSMISEFMQYGISVQGVTQLIQNAEHKPALQGKLRDLQTIYDSFTSYIEEKFITTEEKLDILRAALCESGIVKDSVLVFVGFTGFTPIQNRLLEELLVCSKQFYMALVLGQGVSPYDETEDQELYYLTKKTVAAMEKLAAEKHVERKRSEDVFVPLQTANRELAFLTKNIFGYTKETYEDEVTSIRLSETTSPKQEMKQIALQIRKLTVEQGYAYRDIAVIMGNLEENRPYIEAEFSRMNLPCFIDSNREVELNPLVEFIKSALELWIKNFSYESVMHYLRCGLAGFDRTEVDKFDNYLLAAGVRGKSKYKTLFEYKTKDMEEDSLTLVNSIRRKLMEDVGGLEPVKNRTVREQVDALYEFLVAMEAEAKLTTYRERFEAAGDAPREKEYAQIYRYVMDLLDQVQGLLGDEIVPAKEFLEILEAGIAELSLGIIPKQVDRILVGDMERTRLQNVKVLFFAGMNDGVIPRKTQKGGLISDLDREFLQEACPDTALAPTPRQQMYIQRFYLYLNITKPSEALYLSYSNIGVDGKSIRPSYLVKEIEKLFPKLTKRQPQREPMFTRIASYQDAEDFLAASLRDYAAGTLPKDREEEFYALYRAFGGDSEKRDFLEAAAFLQYRKKMLEQVVARALYTTQLAGSVTRLENYAQCAYRHFIQYGLSLKERKEFGFEAVDMGTLFHAALEDFGKGLEADGKSWFDFDESYASESIKAKLHQAIMKNPSAVYSTYRNLYAVERMERILLRTVMTMKNQLSMGKFVPQKYELRFSADNRLASTSLALSEDAVLELYGSVDRVDLAQDEDRIYVKIVDYKSGNKDFDPVGIYHGLELQLAVYMNVAMELVAKQNPDKEIVPAAMLYYRITDPVIESNRELEGEEVQLAMQKALRSTGVTNEDEAVLYRMDTGLMNADYESIVIPVKTKKDGYLAKTSKVLTGEDFEAVSKYVTKKLISMGREILAGEADQNPVKYGDKEACTYCPVKRVCDFDTKVEGCEYRSVVKEDTDMVMTRMKEE